MDGTGNMDAAEAVEHTALVQAKHSMPIHCFSADPANFAPEHLLFINVGDAILREKQEQLGRCKM